MYYEVIIDIYQLFRKLGKIASRYKVLKSNEDI